MTAATDVRARYLRDSVLSASPARLVTMLYDRLVLDLERAARTAETGDRQGTASHSGHAQDILAELMGTLDVEGWQGGRELFALYTYLLTETLGATVDLDAARFTACVGHVAPLREAWHGAAAELAAEEGTPLPARAVGARGELGVG